MFKIFGKSNEQAEVTPQGSLQVTGWSAFEEAALRGDAYVWAAPDKDIAAAGTMLAVRNEDPDRKLIIVRVEVTNGNVATRYLIHKITAAYTAAGDTPIEINAGGFKRSAPVTAIADETGNTIGAIFAEIGGGVVVETYHRDMVIALNEGEAVAVDQVTESTAGAASIYGYYPL